MTDWLSTLDAVLRSWLGTPWVAGQSRRGVGADCWGFVAGVLDELHGYSQPTVRPVLSFEGEWHEPEASMVLSMGRAGNWPHVLRPRKSEIEPGDVLIVRVGQKGGPGHVLIAGVNPQTLWHANPGVGVCSTSLRIMGTRVLRAWRPTEKEAWRRR